MKKFKLLFAAALLIIGFSGCDESSSEIQIPQDPTGPSTPSDPINPPGETCSDACEAGSECINIITYRTCKDIDGDGCTEWTDAQTCEDGTVCQEGACVESQDSCTNQCDETGTTRCHESMLETCDDYNQDGCLEWGNPTACDEGTICQDGACVDAQNTCTNQCDEKGATHCNENNLETCDDYNEDGCLEWGNSNACENGTICQDGACIVPPTSCTNDCNQNGAKRCNGNSIETCGDYNNDSCLEWGNLSACENGTVCQDGACIVPPPSCTSVCSTIGEPRCNGDQAELCNDYNKDGCLEWGHPEKCEFGCANNMCNKYPECPSGSKVCPKGITKYNDWIEGDTSKSQNVISKYPKCHDVGSTETQDESGPEDYYMVNLTEPGTLIVNVVPDKKSTDVDVHLLGQLNADNCVARGNTSTGAHFDAGVRYISIDTFGGSGNAGSYKMRVFFIPDSSKCGMVPKVMKRSNDSNPLQMPVVGPVGRESHLVTTYDQEKHGGSSWWPKDAWDKDSLKIHKDHTIEMYGSVISYGDHEGDNKWCGCNSSGQCGHASYGKALPPDAEAWDVNMYWVKETRPAAGTRYLAFNPANGKAVVAAAGYETGPAKATSMGGAVPEIHNYFGTQNGYPMLFGELKTQTYEYGPINCFE
ncbi:MAG: hypothetical protein J6A01_12385 [Proteobacteria bacterium]|nr:hypothetical protein [Pseudomonadota bacterium]